MQLFVKSLTGKTIVLNCDGDASIFNLKEKIEDREGIPAKEQRLTYAGKQLKDSNTLEDYNIGHMSNITLSLSLLGGATAIPESFTYALQSRLPPNSFVVTWKEFRPDMQARTADRYILHGQESNPETVNFHLRGAPNEFLLNTNCYLLGSSYARCSQTSEPKGGITNPQKRKRFNASGLQSLYGSSATPISLGHQIDYFDSSRESFNSGSLPYLDNQDLQRSHIINRLRATCARRNNQSFVGDRGKFDMSGCVGGDKPQLTGISGVGIINVENFYFNRGKRYIVVNTSDNNGNNTEWAQLDTGSDQPVQIPLGFYSNLVNSNSVVPLGLMSAYAVNGWSISLRTTSADQNKNGSFASDFANQITYNPKDLYLVDGADNNDGVVQFQNFQHYLSHLRIYAPVVQILDPSVMSSLLSLYEKNEMVNLGGVQFPLSLRMNSLAYRLSSFSVPSSQKDYYFRIAGTDRSVRGIAWWVVDKNRINTTNDLYLSSAAGFRLTRLETKIGNEHVHEVVEDNSPQTNNVQNFIDVNLRHSASLFSPFPQYLENKKHDGMAEDFMNNFNNKNQSENGINDVEGVTTINRGICYGMISFENLDRREGDHAGSYQASGKDLTNVGAIEIQMRFQGVTPVPIQDTDAGVNPPITAGLYGFTSYTQDCEINFAYVYDSIMEISPSGVSDITSSVL